MVVTPMRRNSRNSACRKCAGVPGRKGSAPRRVCGGSSRMCVWASIRPGMSVRRSRSSIRAPSGHGSDARPTRRITPSSTRTAAPSRTGSPVPSNRRPPVSHSRPPPRGGSAMRAGNRCGTLARLALVGIADATRARRPWSGSVVHPTSAPGRTGGPEGTGEIAGSSPDSTRSLPAPSVKACPAPPSWRTAAGLSPSMTGRFPLNTDLVEQNVHRLLGAMTGAATTAMVAGGDQVGLYRAVAEGGPAAPGELAARTGTAERYVREWLSQQAAAGFVAYREGDGRFALPAEAAAVLADEASPVFLAGGATITRGWFAG